MIARAARQPRSISSVPTAHEQRHADVFLGDRCRLLALGDFREPKQQGNARCGAQDGLCARSPSPAMWTRKITSGTGLLSTTGTDETVFRSPPTSSWSSGRSRSLPSALNHYTYEKVRPGSGDRLLRTNSLSQNGFTTILYTSAAKATYVATLDGEGFGSQHGSRSRSCHNQRRGWRRRRSTA